MKLALENFTWTRDIKEFDIKDDYIKIVSLPFTDLWQRTYYHFQNDNAPLFLTSTKEKYFSFSVKTNFIDSNHRFDQCGIVMYLNSQNWFKAAVEFDDSVTQHLGSVVTNQGYSDWATTNVAGDIYEVWYRMSRRNNDYLIESSFDGNHFTQMRIFHMLEDDDEIAFGIYACSPENSSFQSIFTNFEMTDCQWLAHDGQQPD
ncbi:UNVERIFIED_ORG: regulation of enolase protein 1 (concanavalin A-like superfamily) [Leuconostoc holzapfelii]